VEASEEALQSAATRTARRPEAKKAEHRLPCLIPGAGFVKFILKEVTMKSGRWIIIGLLGVVLAAGLAGCQKITSASPDPNQIVEMRPGEKVVFEVEGPVNSLTRRCSWSAYKWGVGYDHSAPDGTNKFEFQADPDGEQTNKISIECWAESLGIWVWEEGEAHSIFIVWQPWDNREWKIRVLQDTRPVWHGTYIIEDDTDLHLLMGYSSITGNLNISIDETTSLEGLESLTTIGGDLIIGSIRALTDLSGLRNLSSVGGDLVIGDNDDLTNLSGLENLTSVGGDLKIDNNQALTSLSALENITSVGGDMYITDNPVLASLSGLENLTSVGETLDIAENDTLTSLCALENLELISGNLYIRENKTLTSLGMTGLNKVNENIRINSNPMLCTSLVEELMDQVKERGGIGGGIYIVGNKDCTTP
jgi:hypothetical protein